MVLPLLGIGHFRTPVSISAIRWVGDFRPLFTIHGPTWSLDWKAHSGDFTVRFITPSPAYPQVAVFRSIQQWVGGRL